MFSTSTYNHRLDENVHGPIDIYVAKTIYEILPFIIKYRITTTHIYIISLILSFITSFLIEKKVKYIPGITFMLSYYFNTVYFIYIEYNSDKDVNIISFRETIINIITVLFLLYTLHKINIHKYINVTILFIGLLCNLGCQIQYFKHKYPDEKIPFIFSKFSIACPLEICSNNLKLENKDMYKIKDFTNLQNNYNDSFSYFFRNINTKYMDQGTIFLIISLYLSFL
jgi:hypothetical protein